MQVNRGPAALARLLDAFAEPTRRRTYEAVRAARQPVSRAQVAESLDISPRLAAFHLDRLVETGMLVAHYARSPERRGGPGAGRPAKWYSPTAGGLEVTVPPRRNDLAARILLQAVTGRAADTPGASAVDDAAARVGREVAQGRHGEEDLDRLLAELGFEPATAPDGTTDLLNCPFHELVGQDQTAVCSMNHAFLEAAARTAGSRRLARLEPREGLCCVHLLPKSADTPPDVGPSSIGNCY